MDGPDVLDFPEDHAVRASTSNSLKTMLHAARRETGASFRALAADSGLSYSAVRRAFDVRETGTRLATLDALFESLGYQIVARLGPTSRHAAAIARYDRRVPLPEGMLDG